MFASFEFWAFVLGILLIYNHTSGRIQNVVLLVASYAIYAYFDWRFLGLLWLATIVNFLIARRLVPSNLHRRRFLYIGIIFNLGLLGIFKYVGFFITTVTPLLNRLGITVNPLFLNILLPLGISFYSFRLLSYLFDDYNKRFDPLSVPLLDFALYVAFFPQIVSGPVERAPKFLQQLRVTRRLSQQQIIDGLTFIFLGVYYKVAIADAVTGTVNDYFGRIAKLTPSEALAAMILFSIQLYADFAGYSLLAIGVSTWFGLPAMENFKQPYFAQSVTEFWTRWHISLSTWFRDYLFYPLSRSLLARFGTQHALAVQVTAYFVTMLATGFWHGANWTFVIWGGLHGIYMAVERILVRAGDTTSPHASQQRTRTSIIGDILVTQLLVCVAWVFFRVSSPADAFLFFQRLLAPGFAPDGLWWMKILTPILMLFVVDFMQFKSQSVLTFWQLRLAWRTALFVFLLLGIVIFGGQASAPFIYFRF